MKFNKILSTALLVVMLFTTVIAAFPVNSYAAYAGSVSSGANVPEGFDEANLNASQLKSYLEEYIKYDFDTAYDMLCHELEAGYLYYVNASGNTYTMYINKYTGFVYYVNNITGQIITSNPINPGKKNSSGTENLGVPARTELMSQIEISFKEASNESNGFVYQSYEWAAKRSQVTVTPITGGMRVNYVLGDTTLRFLAPGLISADSFETNILIPMIEQYGEMLREYCEEDFPEEEFSFFAHEDCEPYDENGRIFTGDGVKADGGLLWYINKIAPSYYGVSLKNSNAEYERIYKFGTDIVTLLMNYSLKDPNALDPDNRKDKQDLDKMHKEFPITEKGIAIYQCVADTDVKKRTTSEIIKKYAPAYTFATMYEDEDFCGYVDDSPQKPVFRCALEYTFNADGSLSVRLPANSITFDETTYILDYIIPLKYFGAGDMNEDGYIFYPDGSGTIVRFDDFFKNGQNVMNPTNTATPYGKDFSYSNIKEGGFGGAFDQQIIMPVYGVVTEEDATLISSSNYNVDKVTNGYFAVLEEGSALARLKYSVNKQYATTYASYTPYPSDKYDLADTISVGSITGSYTIVSESKYTGAYVTRYAMLTDETIGNEAYGKDAYYEASYVGMAAYYRNYLKEKGILEALEIVSEDLPLYVELLGSMEILDRFLTFPITKSIALTSFNDAATIYKQLANCESYVEELYNKYKELYDKETDKQQKSQYEREMNRYNTLRNKIRDTSLAEGEYTTIDNINFKLTGFANGGMDYTYPAKVKWEKACGGKKGFKKLVAYTKEVSKTEGINFSIFADFDFMYLTNTALFDGISTKKAVSKMVDNRYASMQIYDSVEQEYMTTFTMVISADSLNGLYKKFNKQYSKYKTGTLSVSTMGQALNSNFDEDNPINREIAKEQVTNLLDRMANSSGYELMIDTGNIYAVEYATHILNLPIDSSRMKYASATVPFVAIVLHSYVSYTGTPLNYSGIPQYDILRSIESGAAPYYILCYKNTAHMKDDANLKKYYGIDYVNWYDKILTTYKTLNDELSTLQSYEIVDHKLLIAERVLTAEERTENEQRLMTEILIESGMLDDQISKAVDAAFAALKADASANAGVRVKLTVNVPELMNQFAQLLNIDGEELLIATLNLDENGLREGLTKLLGDGTTLFTAETENILFVDAVQAIANKYEDEYCGSEDESKNYAVEVKSIEYNSKYSYITDSTTFDKDYVYTDYTNDNGNVTMVVYRDPVTKKEVTFILNYNSFDVVVNLGAEGSPKIGKYDFIRIEKEVQ